MSLAMTSPDLTLVREFKRRAEAALPGRITRVVLYGSRARGDAREDSDWDVAVFTREDPKPADWSDRGAIAFDLLIETGSLISVLLLPLRRADDGSAMTVSVTADGIAI